VGAYESVAEMNIALAGFLGILLISFLRRSRRERPELVTERSRIVNAHFLNSSNHANSPAHPQASRARGVPARGR
jgi:hypothetical protein